MKDFKAYFLLAFFLLFFLKFICAQELTLKLSSKKKAETTFLSSIDFDKSHQKEKSLYTEIQNISNYVKEYGFFYSVLDSITKKESLYTAHFNLGEKIVDARIKLSDKLTFKNYKIKNDTLYIGVNEISTFLNMVSKKLDNEGKSFAKVRLENIRIKDDKLSADLKITNTKKRSINKVIIKPYTAFPKSYVNQYFNIHKNKDFNKKRVSQISEDSKQLKFITEIKPPEVLFTKDSTYIYMFLKKKQNNSFDGLLNFTTKENGGFLFNGNLDLKLNNILNHGERFELFYNSIAEQVQDFKVSSEIPYIFSSAFSTKIAFNIYKQDSTFLNTTFRSSFLYTLNPKINFVLSYQANNSNDLSENSNSEIKNFSNNFIGLGFNYRVGATTFLDDKLNIDALLSIGNRKTDIHTRQINFNLTTSYLFEFNYRNSFLIRNETGLLNSANYLTNELYRIGGANSIRGFNEQSIFAKKYSYFNSEYRYKTASDSYLFSIVDIGGYVNINNKSDYLLGVGFGYSFKTGRNNFKISTALGKTQNTAFTVNTSKIIINWITSF